jgi:hypothetical protein
MPRSQTKDNKIEIPEDLTGLSDEDLQALHDQAVTAFQAMQPEDGSAPSDEALDAMAALAEGIDALRGEAGNRDAAALSRSNRAKEIADKVLSAQTGTEDDPTGDGDGADSEPDGDEPQAEGVEPDKEGGDADAADTSSLSKRRAPIQIDLGALASQRPAPEAEDEGDRPTSVALAAQGAMGYNVGDKMTTMDMAKAINSRLNGFNASSYEGARARGVRESERFTIARIPREFDERAVVKDEDPADAMKYATDERNLPGGSLVASGGWCAPSQTVYDLVNITEAENLVSIPEIQINRGGIRFTIGPDYSAVFASTGFCYTEAQDQAGNYNGAGGGTKPVTRVPCPGFQEVRLGYCGVAIGAGLLQQRGYPEVIEDYVAKTLNAHAHRKSASVINSMVTQSTAVTMPAAQAGAVAPLLSAIDLQAMHYRAINRTADDKTLEIVLPNWVKGVLRMDLARRSGVDLLDVSDARISGWFAQRNVNPQYVVDWQDIATTPASGFTAAPTGVSFLLYAAGTFVQGVTDSIMFENIYDSVLLGTNDFTALFTEDPFLVAKRMNDSRVVNVGLNPDGSTHIGVDILRNGTATGAGS